MNRKMKITKMLLAFVFVIMLIGIVEAKEICSSSIFQESTNISIDCGENGGEYLFAGNCSSGPLICSRGIDGDYSTGVGLDLASPVTSESNYFINISYEKPYNSLNYSNWSIKIGSGYSGVSFANYSIPDSCWSYNESFLDGRYWNRIWHDGSNSRSAMYVDCWNGTNYITLKSMSQVGLWSEDPLGGGGQNGLNEEFIIWKINPYLKLSFTETTTGTIDHEDGGYSFSGNFTRNMSDFGQGIVIVLFNNGTQKFSFYNNNENTYISDLFVETIDVSRKIKVLGGSQEVSNARVVLERNVGGTYFEVYSEFTNSNGEALVLADDSNNYRITVTKEGYNDYSEIHYFAPGDTETILINLLSEEEDEQADIFSGCPSVIGEERYCQFIVKTGPTKEIGFNYTWNSGNYYTVSNTTQSILNLSINSTTTPVEVNVYVNGILKKTYDVTFSALADRTIQIKFDSVEIKSAGTGPLVLFYLIAILIAILIVVSINRMPKAKGKGAFGAVIWFAVLAINGFPEFWFLALIPIIYYVFKALWGD
jgi:hypothetical protein